MLQLISPLQSKSVLSLRTGGVIADLHQVIVNPNSLKIEGWYCNDAVNKKQLVLLSQDVRQVSAKGLIVNDHEVLSEISDLIRLKDIMNLKFELLGKSVITVSKKKLGKVNDYAFDDQSFFIQKIYVGQSIIKSFSGGNLSIDRSQIVEITNKKIAVQDTTQEETVSVVSPVMTT
jgi:sporulation protein YlmC with PRC-barrel domain